MKPVTLFSVSSLLPARASLLAAAVALAMIPVAHAEDLLGDALAKGKTNLELRYRLENVEQDPMAKTANASTLRTRVRYTSGEWAQTSLMLEMDNVSRVGDDRYNDTRNGKATYPTVVDPDGTDLNQALVKYMGVANTPITVGRQRVNLDNQRWIGSVGWRQNEQALDGVLLEFKGVDKLTATYGFFNRINRINGPDDLTPIAAATAAELDTELHLVNVKYAASGALSAVAYAYLLDYDKFAAASSQTLGLRFTGSVPVGSARFGYSAEVAQQSEYAQRAAAFSAEYMLAELTFGTPVVEAQLGYELLGSDSGVAVQTPLATLHKFQGWADKFLATPATGLVDMYAGVGGKVAGIGYSVAYHTYDSDATSATYGEELNLQVMKTFAKRYTVTLKYADYSKDTFATDTTKMWLMAEAKF
jgi:hypothetical protein